jgi:hypothetical protein
MWAPKKYTKKWTFPKFLISTVGVPTYSFAKHLADLLASTHHVKNSEVFTHTVDALRVTPEDTLVTFHVASLFAKVQIRDGLELQSRQFVEDNLRSFNHALASSYFRFNDQLHKQEGRVASFFVEKFEETALSGAAYKLTCWFLFVDDT